jgi:hypothetical protein
MVSVGDLLRLQIELKRVVSNAGVAFSASGIFIDDHGGTPGFQEVPCIEVYRCLLRETLLDLASFLLLLQLNEHLSERLKHCIVNKLVIVYVFVYYRQHINILRMLLEHHTCLLC